MNDGQWVKAPGNPAADKWLTRDCRRVLVIVPHMTAGTRLGDLLPLLEADHRIQVLFTVPAADDAWPGVEEYVHSTGGVTVPWHQVLRSTFDLALAASYSHVDRISAPVLVVPHGAGGGRSRRSPWIAAGTTGRVETRDLLVRDGRVVPAAVAAATDADARQMREACPEAADRIVVAGDPVYDRIRASAPHRRRYRDALGVLPGRQLVVLSSTWSRYSLFGGDRDLWDRVMTDLPADRYRVVAALHPNMWAAHGRRQVLAWLAHQMSSGLGVLPPQDGWRAALAGADAVIGDHGSVTAYGAAIGVPTLLTGVSAEDVPEGGTAGVLRDLCPIIDEELPLNDQVEYATANEREDVGGVLTQRLTSCPGRSTAILRATMYRLLGLTEPARSVPVSPLPLPTLLDRPTGGWSLPC